MLKLFQHGLTSEKIQLTTFGNEEKPKIVAFI